MAIFQQVVTKAMALAMHRSRAGSKFLGVESRQFRELYDAVSKINAEKINFNIDEMFVRGTGLINTHLAPIMYMNIHENEHLNASVFAFRDAKRGVIPLHDHPGMFGIIKVIHGTIRIFSFSFLDESQHEQLKREWETKSGGKSIRKLFNGVNRWEEKQLMPVIAIPARTLTVDDPPAILTPSYGNIHSVYAVDDTAAFFDVLTPTYYPPDPSRDCHYYRILEANDALTVDASRNSEPDSRSIDTGDQGNQPQKETVTWLMHIEPPRSYYCDSVPFRGPFPISPTETEVIEELKKI